MRKQQYFYEEEGYYHAAIHRKALVYDPRNTNNPIIDDYLQTYKNKNKDPLLEKVMENELNKVRKINLPEIPPSYKQLLHEINISWVHLIHQMIFINGAYDTFCGEFKEVIENVIMADSPTIKESLVYRYTGSGISMFHMAAKIWIYDKIYAFKLSNLMGIKDAANTVTKRVLESYTELEKRLDSKHCIVYMEDFNKVTLMDYLQNFLNNIEFGGMLNS